MVHCSLGVDHDQQNCGADVKVYMSHPLGHDPFITHALAQGHRVNQQKTEGLGPVSFWGAATAAPATVVAELGSIQGVL